MGCDGAQRTVVAGLLPQRTLNAPSDNGLGSAPAVAVHPLFERILTVTQVQAERDRVQSAPACSAEPQCVGVADTACLLVTQNCIQGRPPHLSDFRWIAIINSFHTAQVLHRSHRKLACVTNPGQVAQLVERSPEKAGVGGSIPSLATIIPKNFGEYLKPGGTAQPRRKFIQ